MGGALSNAGVFLVGSLFSIYIILLFLRILFSYFNINFFNPISQFIYKATTPVVTPFQRVIPKLYGIDLATLLVIFILECIKFVLLAMLSVGAIPNIFMLIILSLADMIDQVINIFFYAIILSVILSWVAPPGQTPISTILRQLTEPLMRPARRFIPPIGGFDISPIPVMIGLKLLSILLVQPLLATIQ